MTTVMRSVQSAWRTANFRKLWTAATISTFGSEIAEIALPLLVIEVLSASPAEVSGVRIAQFLPFLLATLPLGVLVDRHRERRLQFMVGADVGRFLLVGLIAVSTWAGFGRIEVVYVLVFLAAVLTVLYQIADFALLPSVVHESQLVDANGKIAASQSVNEIGGRGFGGLLVQALSAPFAVAVNAAAFLGSALTLHRIDLEALQPPEHEVEERQRTAGSARREVVEGLRLALGNRVIRALLGEATTFNVFNEMFILGLLLYGVRELGLSPASLGLVFTAGGVGSFLGAWFGPRLTTRFGYGRVLLLTLTVGNGVPLLAALTRAVGGFSLALLCSIFALMGVGIGIANVHAVSLRQTAVAAATRGRVNAAYRLISWGAIPLGAAGGGVLATAYGAYAAMVVGAAGMAAATLWVAMSVVPRLAAISDAANYAA
jgi:Na+/melibiose symporter-like transporter